MSRLWLMKPAEPGLRGWAIAARLRAYAGNSVDQPSIFAVLALMRGCCAVQMQRSPKQEPIAIALTRTFVDEFPRTSTCSGRYEIEKAEKTDKEAIVSGRESFLMGKKKPPHRKIG